ncbi:hypothetical protein TWF481_010251 [Arthrobotrys musiformis]|uniref:Uncharacterized protein n=1 Tax=Arthrobotrys musiformis TaxID=47236 RepID=A0AAV9W1M7_9PEZI
MNDFRTYSSTLDNKISIKWDRTDISDIAFVQIEVFRVSQHEPYFMTRVPATEGGLVLSTKELKEEDLENPKEKFVIKLHPIGARVTVDIKPWYTQWTSPVVINNRPPFSNRPSSVNKTSHITAISSPTNGSAPGAEVGPFCAWADGAHVCLQAPNCTPWKYFRRPIFGETVTNLCSRTSPFEERDSPLIWAGGDGFVKGVFLDDQDRSIPFGEIFVVPDTKRALTHKSGSLLCTGEDLHCDVWWISEDYKIYNSSVKGDEKRWPDPKVVSDVRVWHNDTDVSSLVGWSDLNGRGEWSYEIWFVGSRGTLFRTIREPCNILDGTGESITSEFFDSSGDPQYVAAGSSLAFTKDDRYAYGSTVFWISPDGAVKMICTTDDTRDPPAVIEIAPAGSAAPDSPLEFHDFGTECYFLWWFGPNQELIGAGVDQEFRDESRGWFTWEQLPAGTGRKDGRSSISCHSFDKLWYVGADDRVYYIERVGRSPDERDASLKIKKEEREEE